MTKHKCSKCLRYLHENDLDRKDGEWICQECEKNSEADDEIEYRSEE